MKKSASKIPSMQSIDRPSRYGGSKKGGETVKDSVLSLMRGMDWGNKHVGKEGGNFNSQVKLATNNSISSFSLLSKADQFLTGPKALQKNTGSMLSINSDLKKI